MRSIPCECFSLFFAYLIKIRIFKYCVCQFILVILHLISLSTQWYVFRIMKKVKEIIKVLGCGLVALTLTACDGVLDGLYDEPTAVRSGVLYVDAISWADWYYVDFHAIRDSLEKGVEPDLKFKPYPVPTTLTGEWDGVSSICTYWYDVFNSGLDKNELREESPADAQEEPEHWDIAIHRNNVRTNGGAVYMTQLHDINQVGSVDEYAGMPFVEDEMNETDVWVISTQMMSGLIGNQRIKVNKELSSWLKIYLPPIPPAFTHNDNVFIIRMKDNTYAAVRLADFISPKGQKCYLTIEYKYPLN